MTLLLLSAFSVALAQDSTTCVVVETTHYVDELHALPRVAATATATGGSDRKPSNARADLARGSMHIKGWQDATGQVDLWSGSKMVEDNHGEQNVRYFNLAHEILLWEPGSGESNSGEDDSCGEDGCGDEYEVEVTSVGVEVGGVSAWDWAVTATANDGTDVFYATGLSYEQWFYDAPIGIMAAFAAVSHELGESGTEVCLDAPSADSDQWNGTDIQAIDVYFAQ